MNVVHGKGGRQASKVADLISRGFHRKIWRGARRGLLQEWQNWVSASTETAWWQAICIHARLWFSFATSSALLVTLVHLARLGFPWFIPVIKVVCNVDLLLSLSLFLQQKLNSDSNQRACSCLHPSIWACFSGVPSLAWMSHAFLRSGDSFLLQQLLHTFSLCRQISISFLAFWLCHWLTHFLQWVNINKQRMPRIFR